MKKRSGSKFIAEAHCKETRLTSYGDKVLVACPHLPPRILDADGNFEDLACGKPVDNL